MLDKENVIKKAEHIMCSTVDRDMIDSFCEDVIALLKEQEAIIRCKDCKWWHESKTNKGYGDCGQANGITLKPSDFFCADGERQEVE